MFGRKSRRIKELEDVISAARGEIDQQENEIRGLKRRLRRLGYKRTEYLETDAIKSIRVELDVSPFGTYAVIEQDENKDKIVEKVKGLLTEKIVKGLMDSELIQFIVREPEPLFGRMTVGAKINVVPWEQTLKRKITVLQKIPSVALQDGDDLQG